MNGFGLVLVVLTLPDWFWSPYWHVSAIVLLADVLFQDTGVDVDWLQRAGNIMTCEGGRVGNTEEMESIWELAMATCSHFGPKQRSIHIGTFSQLSFQQIIEHCLVGRGALIYFSKDLKKNKSDQDSKNVLDNISDESATDRLHVQTGISPDNTYNNTHSH